MVFGETDGVNPPALAVPLPADAALGMLGNMVYVPTGAAGPYLVKLHLTVPVKLDRYIAWTFSGEGMRFFGAEATVLSHRFDPFPALSFPADLLLAEPRHAAEESAHRSPPQPRLAAAPPPLTTIESIAGAFAAGIPSMPPAPCRGCLDRYAVWIWIEAHARQISPQIQTLLLPDGSPRYFVRAQWDLPSTLIPTWHYTYFSITGWVSPEPPLKWIATATAAPSPSSSDGAPVTS